VTPGRAVFDASLLLRAALVDDPAARRWTTEVEAGTVLAFAPSLVWAEVVHALTRYVRAGHLSRDVAQERLVHLLQLPIASEPNEALALGAVPRALAGSTSGYDALYLVLADATDATLVTADRRLAEAASRAELIA
jgi:predicted nucleic acid-binding protein